MSTKIPLFAEEYAFLSNFYVAPFKWNGYVWPTVEHAYQAEKTIILYEQEWIKVAKHPGIAKKIGKKVTERENWNVLKISVMTELIWEKFDQCSELHQMLLDTGSAELIEGNYHHDNFWGDCYCKNCKEVKGQNILGFILMQIREVISIPGHISSAWISNEFIPSVLRSEIIEDSLIKEVVYCIGQEDGNGYEMWHGPNPDEKEMLEVIGKDSKSVIIRFDTDKTHKVIWRWNEVRWIQEGENK